MGAQKQYTGYRPYQYRQDNIDYKSFKLADEQTDENTK